MDLVISTKSTTKHLQIVATTTLIVIFFFATQIENTDARTLSSDDDFFAAPLIKRNTWWTKKSVDMDRLPQSHFEPDNPQFGKCEDAIEVYSCYVERCVQSFVTCARQATNEELFSACKMLHKMCASTCSNGNQNDIMRL